MIHFLILQVFQYSLSPSRFFPFHWTFSNITFKLLVSSMSQQVIFIFMASMFHLIIVSLFIPTRCQKMYLLTLLANLNSRLTIVTVE